MGRLKYVVVGLSKEELLNIISALEVWGDMQSELGEKSCKEIWKLHKKLQGLWIKGDAPPEVIKKAEKMGLID